MPTADFRQGFFGVLESVESNLPDYLKDVARFAYLTGCEEAKLRTPFGKVSTETQLRLRSVLADLRN